MTRSIFDNPAIPAASPPASARARGKHTLAGRARSPKTFVTLRAKTTLIVVVTQLALLVMLAVPLRANWLANLNRLEAQMLGMDVNRAVNSIASDVQALGILNASYAIWDDAYAFVDDRNQKFIDDNFYDQAFVDNRLSLVLLVDRSGQVVFGKAFDLASKQALPLPDRFRHIASGDPLIANLTLTNSITGVVDLPLAPMIVAAHAIVTIQGSGPIRGALLMGRYLDAPQVQRLAASTQIAFTIQLRPDPPRPSALPAARPAFASGGPITIQPFGDDMIMGVPSGPPKWIYAAIAGAVIVCALVVFLVAR